MATIHYDCDDSDQLIGMVDAEQGRQFKEYDGSGNSIKEIDSLKRETKYNYNAMGLPIQISDAKDGSKQLKYVYSPTGWVDPFGLRRKRGSDTPRHGPTAVTKVNNRMPINSCFAGKTMMGKDLPVGVRGKYSHGVPFNSKGFPDFSRYARTTVNIGSFTKDDADFRSANAKIGLAGKKAPDNFV